jgi:hypothetical protein
VSVIVCSSIWVLTGVLGRNENELAWLSGVPSTVRTLSVAENRCVSSSREGDQSFNVLQPHVDDVVRAPAQAREPRH